MTPAQVQRVPLKSPGDPAIPVRKSFLPRPVHPSLNLWQHYLRLWHTHAAAVSQLVIQEHLNHI